LIPPRACVRCLLRTSRNLLLPGLLRISERTANKRPVTRLIAGVVALLLTTVGAAPPAPPLGFPELYKSIKPSVVYILTTLPSGRASGSGFVYDSDASETIIATAAHVVANAVRVEVVLDSDISKRVSAKILQNDAKRDVAFLSIPVGNRKPLRMADRDQIVEGTTIAAIGYPRAATVFETMSGDDLRPSVHMGIISAVRVNGELIQIDAQTDHGDSGGPIVDTKTGRVIGIVRGALLDPTYLAAGVQQALPGTGFAASSTVVYGVRNGLISATKTATATPSSATASGSNSEYRVAFIMPSVTPTAAMNPTMVTVITELMGFYTRFRSHFTADNSLYAIAGPGNILTLDATQLRTVCDNLHVNGVMLPTYNMSFKDSVLKTEAGFYVEDCSGVPYYGRVVRTAHDRTPRLTNDVLITAGNDAIDQNLKQFDEYRDTHRDTWMALLKSGAPVDSPAKHVLATMILSDGQYRVAHLNPIGTGAKAGLKEGDLISAVDGKPIEPGTLTWELALAIDTATTVEVKRPDGTITITLR